MAPSKASGTASACAEGDPRIDQLGGRSAIATTHRPAFQDGSAPSSLTHYDEDYLTKSGARDLTRRTFGRLTVIEKARERARDGHEQWVCSCSCGTRPVIVCGHCLQRKGARSTRSCGCLRKKPPLERFSVAYIPEPNSGCWLWLGSPTGSLGYGNLWVDGRFVLAHRYSWEIANGPIPGGLWVLHRCNVPACVNPEHLFLGTAQDNSTDMVRKGRQSRGEAHVLATQDTRARGERVSTAKLTFQQVQEIRASAMALRPLAAIYGVAWATIWAIKQRKTWQTNGLPPA
jgi:HNH endonuclease